MEINHEDVNYENHVRVHQNLSSYFPYVLKIKKIDGKRVTK